MSKKELRLQFQINCNLTQPGQEVFIIGNSRELGNWKKSHIKEIQQLYCIQFPIWQSIPIPFKNKSFLEYKFIIKKPSDDNLDNIRWEKDFEGNRNRTLDIRNLTDSLYLIDEGNFNDKSNQTITNLEENNDYNNNDNKNNININNISKKGLSNIGATCYMNSTLQCFFHIKKFTDFFRYNPQIRNDNRTTTLSYSFRKIIDDLHSNNNDSGDNNNSSISPYEFKEKISNMNPLFRGISANDAKDLVNFIIMTLHEELNKSPKNKNNFINYNKFIVQRNEKITLYNFLKDFNNNNNSIIKDLFYAINGTMTQCSNCFNILYNYQVYFFLVFPLEEIRKFKLYNNFNNNQLNIINNSNNNEVSLFDCFNYETKINLMSGVNNMYCNNCKINTSCSMKTNLVNGPEILILLLNRGKGIEFNVKIIFGEYLNLYNYILYKNTGYKYKLIGVITHLGESGMGGHFIAYCRDPINGEWNKYNDAIVTDVIDFQNEVINFANPYLLFYQKYL